MPQKTLPANSSEPPLIPARMLNEFVYCPRLAYLMWVQSEWADNADTVDGRRVHQRVDKRSNPLPSPDNTDADCSSETKIVSQSIMLSSEKLGVIAKIDIAETKRGIVTPIDISVASARTSQKGHYLPERIQLCVQAMLLEEHGYSVSNGFIFFAESRERTQISFSEELRAETKQAISDLRHLVCKMKLPAPLEDSPKCPRCSLVTICLPDETCSFDWCKIQSSFDCSSHLNMHRHSLFSRRGQFISKKGEALKIVDGDSKEQLVRLIDISDVCPFRKHIFDNSCFDHID